MKQKILFFKNFLTIIVVYIKCYLLPEKEFILTCFYIVKN